MTNALAQLGVERQFPKRGDLCLCLSGGGFRAAAFHLGVTRWLVKTGALRHVGEVRGVSGGAIVAGWMACNAEVLFSAHRDPVDVFETQFAAPLREFIGRDIRTWPIASTLGINLVRKRTRVERLTRTVSTLLGSEPVVVPSTVRFRLVAFDIDSQRSIDLDPTLGPVAQQVIASAAFPPIIGPAVIDGRRLVDGGVASNLGVTGETLNSWKCVVISDASRAFPRSLHNRRTPVSLRLIPLLRDGANRATREHIATANSETSLAVVVPLAFADWYGDNDAKQFPTSETASKLPTDLARFNASRIRQLERAGEDMANIILSNAFAKWAGRIASGEEHLRPNCSDLDVLLTRGFERGFSSGTQSA